MKQFWILDFGFSIHGARIKKSFALLVAAFLFALCSSAEAQQPKKLYRIGYLSPVNASRESTEAAAVRQALRELGYIEGNNLAIEYRYAEGKLDRLPALSAELVSLNVDLIIVSGGNRPIQAAKKVTKTVPIIMMGVGPDPVEAGFVQSLARPGGNITGLSSLRSELGGKRLELLKETVPKIARVGALYARPTTEAGVKQVVQVTARALAVTVQPWEVQAADDFGRVFTALDKQRPDGLWVHEGRLMRDNQKRIADFALKSRLPAVFPYSEGVDAGGLMYYGADLADSYRRIAIYVDKILKGVKPADLPVEQPTKFEFIINLKTAKQIDLTIPPTVLARADRVMK